MFWGVIFLVVGAVIILNAVFGIDIPLVRILVGLFVLYIGIKIVFAPSFRPKWNCDEGNCNPAQGKVIFRSGHAEPTQLSELNDREFSTIFGHGELDLTKTNLDSESSIKINTVFGDARVVIGADVNLVPKVNSVIGEVSLPSTPATAGGKTLNMEINNVFGSTHIERK